ncbi:hypothetical protein SAMN06265375_103382 [Muriicola jejuensis]|uniref:Uncharacterized protein n=1 Tax=Muriicola jejuensis TaxID=504488 RepID=A0A6P0UDJ4_9FLAO|nr:DUF6155 family protein [Muriicola jejuensis]NER11265.1 hypothetical protein [Muriicola jejuensis]SMP21823.1 hypothetical protein SAMN06265375_103382 [Muriicola jejuensis]
MSKSALKKYVRDLKKKDLEIQIMDLYERISQVKTYYDFVFNPKEDKLLGEAKARISNEYFPVKRKRPRARRSVAQKLIRKFETLGMDPYLLADLMLFNLETAQRYASHHKVHEAFYKSMLRSFTEAVSHIARNALRDAFTERLEAVSSQARKQDWGYAEEFERVYETLVFTKL